MSVVDYVSPRVNSRINIVDSLCAFLHLLEKLKFFLTESRFSAVFFFSPMLLSPSCTVKHMCVICVLTNFCFSCIILMCVVLCGGIHQYLSVNTRNNVGVRFL